MIFDSPHFIDSDGFRIATYASGQLSDSPEAMPPIILIHGWPEMAYSWSRPMQMLADAGYPVIAYDLRGFGYSDAPLGVEHYSMVQSVADLNAVMTAYGLERAIICGHDWGGIIVWHAARILAQKVRGVISVCTPHVKSAPADPVEIYRKRYGAEHYFVHFNDRPGEADQLFADNVDAFFQMMFRSTPKTATLTPDFAFFPQKFAQYLAAGVPPLKGGILTEAERDVFVRGYKRAGFHGGLNHYRNTGANWKLGLGLSTTIPQPALMLSPEDDLLLPPALTDPMVKMIPNLERQTIKDCGHWAMWEQPEAIADAISQWVGRVFIA